MKLYYAPRTRASRPRWLLEELRDAGAPVDFELVRIDMQKGEHKRADYLAIHPHGSVPALSDGDTTMFESAAICLYLADKYIDAGLAPAFGSKERAHYYQWVLYGMATIEAQIIRSADEIGKLPEAERPAGAIAARKKFETIAQVVSRAVGDKGFMMGDRFTAADVVAGGSIIWGNFQGFFDEHPVVKAYAKRLADRPASRRARAD